MTREEIPHHMLEGIDDLGLDLAHMSRAEVAEAWVEWADIQGYWSTVRDLVRWAHPPSRPVWCYALNHPKRGNAVVFELAADAMAAEREGSGVWTLHEWGWQRGEWRVTRLDYRAASV